MRYRFIGLVLSLSACRFDGHPYDFDALPVSADAVAALEDRDSLLELESKIRNVSAKAVAATVAIEVGFNQGSGVLVSSDGLVLTAAHVIGRPDMRATITLSDGRRLNARTLGCNILRDSAMLKIRNVRGLPFVELSELEQLELGDWCISTGHPGGYQEGRGSVVRLGRMLQTRVDFLRTDCAIISGDSGGPLFNLEGELIGIHSRIEVGVSSNYHVPLRAFTRSWDRLESGEGFGLPRGAPVQSDVARSPTLGVLGLENLSTGVRIGEVDEGMPAAEAGLKGSDVIHTFDGVPLANTEELIFLISDVRAGDAVEIGVYRNGHPMTFTAVLAATPEEDE